MIRRYERVTFEAPTGNRFALLWEVLDACDRFVRGVELAEDGTHTGRVHLVPRDAIVSRVPVTRPGQGPA